MFLQEREDRYGVSIIVKYPEPREYYLERWEARKIHEGLSEIIKRWEADEDEKVKA